MKQDNPIRRRACAGSAREPAAEPALQECVMKCRVFLTVLLITVAPAAFGQALPAAQASPISTGFELPMIAGTLQYAVSASESLSWGYYNNSGITEVTNLTGDLGFISTSK